MTFLPIVDRELRIASRKGWTFWLRVVAAGIAAFIASGFLLIAVAEAAPTAQLGGPLFKALSWLSLAATLSVGLFFTSDCLSEEKREGTLGFLFLTDLRGYDVVLGKLLATSLRCIFGLLAVFPILAITQLMGGVAPDEFWKTLLALAHALFFSLACGMFVSSISRNGQKAMSGTLVLLLVFLAIGPLLDLLIAQVRRDVNFRPLLSLSSPGYVFLCAGRGASLFWEALWPSNVIAWLMLAASAILVRRNWQEKATKSSPTVLRWRYWWRYGGVKRRTAFRTKQLEINPVKWLACRERWQRVSVWLVCGAILIGNVALFIAQLGQVWWGMWQSISGLVSLLFYLWVASQATQFFTDARRSGLLEMLLATPLSSREMVMGVWRALLWVFALPVILYLSVQIIAAVISLSWNWRSVGIYGGLGRNLDWSQWLAGVGSAVISAIHTLTNLVALSWFGIWMGLISKNARFATLKTLLFVQIIPWFVLTFASGIAASLLIFPTLMNSSGGNRTYMMMYPLIMAAAALILTLAKNALFYFWARKRLMNDFREMAAQAIAPVRANVAPPIAPAVMSTVPAPPFMPKT